MLPPFVELIFKFVYALLKQRLSTHCPLSLEILRPLIRDVMSDLQPLIAGMSSPYSSMNTLLRAAKPLLSATGVVYRFNDSRRFMVIPLVWATLQ
jgi:hypothetical protein